MVANESFKLTAEIVQNFLNDFLAFILLSQVGGEELELG